MTERGVFAVDRGIFEHPVFAPEPLTEREAWTWLISEAAWKTRTRRIGKFVVKLARGELAASHRHLAEKWRWSPPRIARFLNRLKIETMIETRSDTGITVIKICKYNKYQKVGLPSDTLNDTLNETVAINERYNTETLLKTLGNKEEGAIAPSAEDIASNVVPIRRDYQFEGRNLKLSATDYDRWKNQYPAVEDFDGTLRLIDDYYSENPRDDGKYFFPAAKWLLKENTEAKDRRQKELRRRGDAW